MNTKQELSYEDYINSLEFEEKIKIQDIFELFDKNLDGGIDIKELKFILNSLDIFPNHDELLSMMYEADVSKKGFISKN
jgi:Ca2+-binding EF-hand superfamily protein